MPGLKQTPGMGVAYRDYMRTIFVAALSFAMTLPLKRKKSYDINLKLKAVEEAEKKSKEAAAREFCVDPKRIQDVSSFIFSPLHLDLASHVYDVIMDVRLLT